MNSWQPRILLISSIGVERDLLRTLLFCLEGAPLVDDRASASEALDLAGAWFDAIVVDSACLSGPRQMHDFCSLLRLLPRGTFGERTSCVAYTSKFYEPFDRVGFESLPGDLDFHRIDKNTRRWPQRLAREIENYLNGQELLRTSSNLSCALSPTAKILDAENLSVCGFNRTAALVAEIIGLKFESGQFGPGTQMFLQTEISPAGNTKRSPTVVESEHVRWQFWRKLGPHKNNFDALRKYLDEELSRCFKISGLAPERVDAWLVSEPSPALSLPFVDIVRGVPVALFRDELANYSPRELHKIAGEMATYIALRRIRPHVSRSWVWFAEAIAEFYSSRNLPPALDGVAPRKFRPSFELDGPVLLSRFVFTLFLESRLGSSSLFRVWKTVEQNPFSAVGEQYGSSTRLLVDFYCWAADQDYLLECEFKSEVILNHACATMFSVPLQCNSVVVNIIDRPLSNLWAVVLSDKEQTSIPVSPISTISIVVSTGMRVLIVNAGIWTKSQAPLFHDDEVKIQVKFISLESEREAAPAVF